MALQLNRMMMMNLTTNPWIPAIRTDGSRDVFSLQELFQGAHRLRDLALKPHERISVMRLLVCITQAALDGPVDEDDWQECEPIIQPKVAHYLEKWAASFELFGDGPRFLQFENLQPGKETDDGNAATKLDLTLATGNNPTLFDNGASEARRVHVLRAPLNLLTFQCFAPCNLIGAARWNGKDISRCTAKAAPCAQASMIHALVLGSSLLETIRFNLLAKETVADSFGAEKWGKPVWELPVRHGAESSAIANATLTYLGRLVPLSRAIRLNPDGVSVILANGLEYPIYPAYREATATIRKMDHETKLLPASTERGIWRQLPAIVVKGRADGDAICGPLALCHNFGANSITLWVGAMVTDKAKIEEVLESVYALPSGMFSELGRVAYEKGVSFAGKWEFALRNALKEYAVTLKIVDPSFTEATRVFWTRLEQHLSDLFFLAQNPDLIADLAASVWGRAVKTAAHDAYHQCCPRQTSRQIEAYARGLRRLSVIHETQTTPVENE